MDLFNPNTLPVVGRRFQQLAARLVTALPRYATVVDVGTGTGDLAHAVMLKRPDLKITGIDVLIREHTALPVHKFNGTRIPYEDGGSEAVMFVDVLHHTEDPEILLREAARVARKCIVIKDHLAETGIDRGILKVMDWVGNAMHGVALPYTFWSEAQWRAAIARAGLQIVSWETNLQLYTPPAHLLFDRKLHVLMVLAPAGKGGAAGEPVRPPATTTAPSPGDAIRPKPDAPRAAGRPASAESGTDGWS